MTNFIFVTLVQAGAQVCSGWHAAVRCGYDQKPPWAAQGFTGTFEALTS